MPGKSGCAVISVRLATLEIARSDSDRKTLGVMLEKAFQENRDKNMKFKTVADQPSDEKPAADRVIIVTQL